MSTPNRRDILRVLAASVCGTTTVQGASVASEQESSANVVPAARQGASVDGIDEVVDGAIREGLFPGAVVAGGGLTGLHFLKAYGHAQVTPTRVCMYEDARFDLESVTKVVAGAAALAICMDRGLVDVDRPVAEYLPGLTGRGVEGIRVRHLVTHTSGFKFGRVLHENETGDLFEKLEGMGPVMDVGAQFVYSNRNAILTGMLVETVTGQDLGTFCRHQVFEPLGLRNTRFGPVAANTRVAASRSDVLGVSGNEDVRNARRPIATAGLFSTAEDLARFCRLWLGRGEFLGVRLFSEETWSLATSNLSPVPEHAMGLFWFKHSTLDRPNFMSDAAIGHAGYSGQSIWLDPTRNAYTVVLTNRNHPRLEPKSTQRGQEQYMARARIADTLLRDLGLR